MRITDTLTRRTTRNTSSSSGTLTTTSRRCCSSTRAPSGKGPRLLPAATRRTSPSRCARARRSPRSSRTATIRCTWYVASRVAESGARRGGGAGSLLRSGGTEERMEGAMCCHRRACCCSLLLLAFLDLLLHHTCIHPDRAHEIRLRCYVVLRKEMNLDVYSTAVHARRTGFLFPHNLSPVHPCDDLTWRYRPVPIPRCR